MIILQENTIFRNGQKITLTKATQKYLPNNLIDQLLTDYKKPEDLHGENGPLQLCGHKIQCVPIGENHADC